MLNYLWGGMILLAVVYGAFSGNIQQVGNSMVDSSKEAVSLCITMLGVVSMWTGLMEIGNQCGLMDKLTKILNPFIRFLFPRVPKGHKSLEYISANMAANILGLGWAATPAGIKAMEKLKELEEEREEREKSDNNVSGKKKYHKNRDWASDEMCTFLTINISSLQLIPVNIIAYRAQYGSIDPAEITGPAILATSVSTLIAVIYCKIRSR